MNRLCMGCMEQYSDQFDVCPYCGYIHGSPAKEAYHIKPGSLLNKRYIIGRVLGFGGFGVTYIGYDTLLDHKVAVKEYLPSEFSTRMPEKQEVTVYSGEKEEQFKAGLKKILDEARNLARFQDEPGIVHIFDCFESNNTAYIIMEYLDGESLQDRLDREGKMATEEAVPIILSLLSALKHVHAEGIIHRDISPHNIYLLKTGEVKLLDFGAARYATTQHSKSLSVMLKPGYAPEEQYRSRGDQGPWTDVYGLAATFYKMITGITPEDAMERSVKDTVKEPSKLGIKITKSMETALMNALNVKIEDRTQSAEEFEEELNAAEVKRKEAAKKREDFGSIPLWFKISAGAAALLLAVFIGLLATGVIPVGDRISEFKLAKGMTRVPDVRNEEQETAEQKITESELLPVLNNATFSEEVMGGRVLSQSIGAGETVEKDTEVSLTISAGKELVQMPLLTGLTREEAEEKLDELGISYTVTERVNIASEGTVIEQSIENSVQIEKHSASVELVVSLDMGEFDEIFEIDLEELAGRDVEEIRKELEEKNIELKAEGVYEKEIPKGQIISQTQEPGTKVVSGDTVTVTYSLGVETVALPLVTLQDEGSAREAAEAAGFTVTVEQEYSDSVSAGKVIRAEASDSQGRRAVSDQELLEKGTEIVLIVSRGRPPASDGGNSNQRNRQPAGNEAKPRQTEAPTPQPTQAPQPAPQPTEAPQPAPEPAPAPAPETPKPGAGLEQLGNDFEKSLQ